MGGQGFVKNAVEHAYDGIALGQPLAELGGPELLRAEPVDRLELLGEVVAIKKEPGLYVKAPFVDSVVYFDKRIVTLDWEEPDRFITSEKKNVLVDSFVKWRIIDPQKYYVSVRGDEVHHGVGQQQLPPRGDRGSLATIGSRLARPRSLASRFARRTAGLAPTPRPSTRRLGATSLCRAAACPAAADAEIGRAHV